MDETKNGEVDNRKLKWKQKGRYVRKNMSSEVIGII